MSYTSYEINYGGMAPNEAHNKAIADIRDHIGDETYERIVEAARSDDRPMTLEQFAVFASITGVRGYPVRAWHAEIWPFG
jgi:hypothetical protein